jgi:hypothetical protein
MKTLNLPYECETREFKELRRRAHTTEGFETLAKWCQLRAEFYRKKQSACEAELRADYLPMLHIRAASHSSCDLILKTQLAGELSEQWSELASFYLAKAAELGAAKLEK